MKHKIVEVKWVEASKAKGRISKVDQANLTGINSVGYLLDQNDQTVVLAGSLLAGQIEDLTVIPRTSISKMIYLTEEKEDEGSDTVTPEPISPIDIV